MEGFDPTLGRGLKPDFDEAPARFRRRIGGVDYLHLKGRQNGDLFIMIVRPASHKRGILRRHDQPVLGLIDYELLVPARPE